MLKVSFVAQNNPSFSQIKDWARKLKPWLEEWQAIKIERISLSGFRIIADMERACQDESYVLEFDGELWHYECEEGMFLVAKLPPAIAPSDWHKNKLEKIERIVSVEGHFGSFEGEDALRSYEARENWAWETFSQVYNACEVVGVFKHSGWERENFVHTVWSMLHDKEFEVTVDEAELERAMTSPILQNISWSFNDRLRNQSYAGSGRERISLRQLASLIVSLRGHQSGQSPKWRPIEL